MKRAIILCVCALIFKAVSPNPTVPAAGYRWNLKTCAEAAEKANREDKFCQEWVCIDPINNYSFPFETLTILGKNCTRKNFDGQNQTSIAPKLTPQEVDDRCERLVINAMFKRVYDKDRWVCRESLSIPGLIQVYNDYEGFYHIYGPINQQIPTILWLTADEKKSVLCEQSKSIAVKNRMWCPKWDCENKNFHQCPID